MKRTKINLDLQTFPSEISAFLTETEVYDSSCSNLSKVYYIDKGQGYFLKIAAAGFLKSEQLMHRYFHNLGLTTPVIFYETIDNNDYLITERIPGEDCTHYMAEPERLCDTIAENLRMLHNQPFVGCPIKNRITDYVNSVFNGHSRGKYEHDLFEGLWEFSSIQSAWEAAKEGIKNLEPNILFPEHLHSGDTA